MTFSEYLDKHYSTKKKGNVGQIIRKCAFEHGYTCKSHAQSREHVIYGSDSFGREVVIKNTGENEIIALKALQEHSNHVTLIDFFWATIHSDSAIIVLEQLSGDLINLVELNGGRLTEYNAFRYLYQIVDAVNYLHEQQIYHRDIAPDNILYDSKKDKVYLCDLGLVQINNTNTCTKPVGKILYAAPELLLVSKGKENLFYSDKLDIWCIGCLLCYMIFGDMPWKKSSVEFHEYVFKKGNQNNFSSYLKETHPHFEIGKYTRIFLNYILKEESLHRPTSHGLMTGLEIIM
tara:strand:- start:1040 stop:1909 length:870 start_codon:yes stop_codon:yes gene_type:complete